MIEVNRYCVGLFGVNCYFVRKDNHLLIVDPGASFNKLLSHVHEDDVVEGIILTHGHFDHIGAVDKLQAHFKCPVYLNPMDEKLARDVKLNSMAQFSGTIHCPITELKEGIIKIGDFELLVTEAPGHTSGSTCIQIENYLFTGDVLFKGSIGRTDLYSGNASEMKRSLQLFSTMNEDLIVCPGHEEMTTLKEELLTNPYL